MDKTSIHNMVEYINLQEEFPFYAAEVEEAINDVIAFFGFHPDTSPEERKQMKRDLMARALGVELGEVSRLVEAEESRLLTGLRPYRRGWYKEPSVSAGTYVERMRRQ